MYILSLCILVYTSILCHVRKFRPIRQIATVWRGMQFGRQRVLGWFLMPMKYNSVYLQFSKRFEISDCPLSNFLHCGVRVAPSFQPVILIRSIPVSCFRDCAPYAHLRKSCWRLGTPLSFCMDTWIIILEYLNWLEYTWALELQLVLLLIIWDVLGIKFWEKAEQNSLVHMRGMSTWHFEAMWRTFKTRQLDLVQEIDRDQIGWLYGFALTQKLKDYSGWHVLCKESCKDSSMSKKSGPFSVTGQ